MKVPFCEVLSDDLENILLFGSSESNEQIDFKFW